MRRNPGDYVQVRRPGGLPFATLVACLIGTMVAVYATQQVGLARRGRTHVKGRSTDRID